MHEGILMTTLSVAPKTPASSLNLSKTQQVAHSVSKQSQNA